MTRWRTKEAVDELTGRPIREQTIELREARDLMASERLAEAELVVEEEEKEEAQATTAMTLARWQEPTRPPGEPPPSPTGPPPRPQGPPPDFFTAKYYRPPPAGQAQRTAVGLALGALVGGMAAALLREPSRPRPPSASPMPSRSPPSAGPPPPPGKGDPKEGT